MLELYLWILGLSFVGGVIGGLLNIPSPRDIPQNFRITRPSSLSGGDRLLLTQVPRLVLPSGQERRRVGQGVLRLRQLPKASDQGDGS